jgi:hypothetical protein
VSKTPNLVQRQTGVYKFPPVVLPKITVITPPSRDPGLPSRVAQPAPQPTLNTPKAPAGPLGPMTNTPNQVRR